MANTILENCFSLVADDCADLNKLQVSSSDSVVPAAFAPLADSTYGGGVQATGCFFIYFFLF